MTGFMILQKKSLLVKARDSFGNETNLGLSRFFEKTLLPPLQSGEYITSRDGGYIMFLDAVGIAIHIRDPIKAPIIDDFEVLQPIGTYQSQRLTVAVFPGRVSPIERKDRPWLIRSLQIRGLHMHDPQLQNAGYIIKPENEDQTPHVAVLDLDAVERLSYSTTLVSELPGYIEHVRRNKDNQRKLFHELSAAFNELIENTDPSQYGVNARKFWGLCRQKYEQGILIPSWSSRDGTRTLAKMEVQSAGENYALQWDGPT